MVATGDTLEFLMRSAIDGYSDIYLNVFHYRVFNVTTPFALNEIDGINFLELWYDDVIAPMLAGFSSKYSVRGITATDYTTDEFYDWTFTSPDYGDSGGDVLNPFYALGVRLNRASRITRSGSKRFTGQAEMNFVDGQPTSTYLTFLDGVLPRLGQARTYDYDGNVLDLEPRILRKTGATTFSASNQIASVSLKGSTTQNTRKPGRGS